MWPSTKRGGGDDGAEANKGGDGPRFRTIAGPRRKLLALSSQLVLPPRLRCGVRVTSLWTRDLIKDNHGKNITWENAASPLLEGGLIYVAGGGPGQSILAFNPADGAVVWKAFDEKMTHATPVVATILGQRQIIFFLQSGLLSVEPKTGKELWRYAFRYNTSTAASPVVSNDIVYCSAGYGVGAGAVKVSKEGFGWSAREIYRLHGNKPLANHWSTPVCKDGNLYGMFQFKEFGKGPVKCVDISNGQVKWEQTGFGPGQVILAGDQVVALSDAGDLVLIATDPAAYKELAPRPRSRGQVLDDAHPGQWAHLRPQHQGSSLPRRLRKIARPRSHSAPRAFVAPLSNKAAHEFPTTSSSARNPSRRSSGSAESTWICKSSAIFRALSKAFRPSSRRITRCARPSLSCGFRATRPAFSIRESVEVIVFGSLDIRSVISRCVSPAGSPPPPASA